MKARIFVTLKPSVLDPQGQAIEHAFTALGMESIKAVRQGKLFELELDARTQEAARALLKAACEKLLVNSVMEKCEIEVYEEQSH